MPKYKSSLQDSWLENKKFVAWLQKDKDNNSLARCKVCRNTFSIAPMGVKALDAHANGAKHKERLPCNENLVLSFASS
jgi:hypothetical protein